MKKQKRKLPIKPVFLSAAIFIAAIFIIRYIVVSLKRLDYFRIKEVVLKNEEESFDSSYLLGRNIFDVDLKKESGHIARLYPVYKDIRLFRVLPDRLVVIFTERDPIACVKLYRDFYVDAQGVLFAPDKEEGRELPVIVGLEKKIRGPETGRRYYTAGLLSALDIIKQINDDLFLKQCKVERIDVRDPVNISCFIRMPDPDGENASFGALEVKMANKDMAGQVIILSGLLGQLNEDAGNIKYIDLRFKEPVVRPKNVK